MYVYIKSEPNLWTVGFYKPSGEWEPESDCGSAQAATERVHYLNGAEALSVYAMEQEEQIQNLKDIVKAVGAELKEEIDRNLNRIVYSEDLVKPILLTCSKCGGKTYIIPCKEKLSGEVDYFEPKTINICGACTLHI